jgi:hypothetical protein
MAGDVRVVLIVDEDVPGDLRRVVDHGEDDGFTFLLFKQRGTWAGLGR